MPPEYWKPVVGAERYSVSNLGRVRGIRFGSILKQCWASTSPYLSVCIHKKQRKVHHLVAEAFIGPRPDGLLCLHKDDDRSNNTLENLYWGTSSENEHDKIRNGKAPDQRGANGPRAKLTEQDVLEIRALLADGLTQKAVADRFGVRQATVWRIHRRLAWATLP